MHTDTHTAARQRALRQLANTAPRRHPLAITALLAGLLISLAIAGAHDINNMTPGDMATVQDPCQQKNPPPRCHQLAYRTTENKGTPDEN